MSAIAGSVGRWALQQGGIAGNNAVQHIISAGISSAINPATREVQYRANARVRNLELDVPHLAKLWHGQALTDENLSTLLSWHGIGWDGIPGNVSLTKYAWSQFLRYSKPSFDLGDYRKWYRQGRVSPAFFKEVFKRHGFGEETERKLFIDDYEAVPLPLLVGLYHAGVIGEQEVIDRAVAAGHRPDDTRELLKVMQAYPAPMELLALANRQVISGQQLDDSLKRLGMIDPAVRKQYKDLRFALPSESMLTLCSVREVWDEQVAARFGYDAELPRDYVHFMNMLGYDWSAYMPGRQQPGGRDLTWPEAYWRAHWRVNSPEQGYRMFHMLRGDPNDPATWRFPGVRPFTRDDLETTLKINDYAPGIREALINIAYLPMRLVDIRASVRYLRQPQAWAYEQFLDRGHRPEHAAVQARLAVAMAKRQNNKAVHQVADNAKRQFLNHMLKEYGLGMIDRDTAINTLVGSDMDLADATTAVTNIDLEAQEAIVTATIAQARKDYFAGRDSFQGVWARLSSAGMNQRRIDEQLTKWKIERGQGRIVLSTETALRLMRKGIITYDEAYRRLINLNWANADALLRLSEVQFLMQEDVARELQAQQMDRRRQAKEVERLVREMQARIEKLQGELRRNTPITTVLKWLKGGRVNADWARNRLLAMGYSADVADQYIKEALSGTPGN